MARVTVKDTEESEYKRDARVASLFWIVYHHCEAIYTPAGVMIYSPEGADDIHLAKLGDDIPSLQLG